jgi:antirestriction protein ArdC
MNTEKAQQAINKILEALESGNLPTFCLSVFECPDVPAKKYSFLNKLILAASNTFDARGFQTWKKAGRTVKAGTRAVWIFAPFLVPAKKAESESDAIKADGADENPGYQLRGFKLVPVFRAEDTEGKPLGYDPPKLPEIPLLEVAEKWGIAVSATVFAGRSYGSYLSAVPTGQAGNGQGSEIELRSPEAEVFFHELAHAAHDRLLAKEGKNLKPGQHQEQEVVAELAAGILAATQGVRWNPERVAAYVASYKADKWLVIRLMGTVEKVVETILREAQDKSLDAARQDANAMPQCA